MGDVVFRNTVVLNERLEPGKNSKPFQIPAHNTLIITDIVIQNRAPGDAPVKPEQSSRIAFSNFANNLSGGFFLTVHGNDPLIINLQTGIPFLKTQTVQPPQHVLQIQNVGSSTAPFVEFVITGYLVASDE